MSGSEDPGNGVAPLRPVELAHVVVPLDGSDSAARAVPIARQLAALVGARLTVLAVSIPGEDHGSLQQHVEQTAARIDGDAVLVEGDEVPVAILTAARQLPHHVVCMTSHGRGRSASLVGSVAADLAARASEPLVLIGPQVPDDHRLAGRLVACVDGSAPSESVLPTAASWAAALALGLSIVTVAEPVPEPVTPGAPYHRMHGPEVVAEDYVGRLVQQWQGHGLDVDGDAVYHPVSVAGGLADYLEGRPAALVAATTRARTGIARLVLGSVAAAIVRHATAPVLVVPGPA